MVNVGLSAFLTDWKNAARRTCPCTSQRNRVIKHEENPAKSRLALPQGLRKYEFFNIRKMDVLLTF